MKLFDFSNTEEASLLERYPAQDAAGAGAGVPHALPHHVHHHPHHQQQRAAGATVAPQDPAAPKDEERGGSVNSLDQQFTAYDNIDFTPAETHVAKAYAGGEFPFTRFANKGPILRDATLTARDPLRAAAIKHIESLNLLPKNNDLLHAFLLGHLTQAYEAACLIKANPNKIDFQSRLLEATTLASEVASTELATAAQQYLSEIGAPNPRRSGQTEIVYGAFVDDYLQEVFIGGDPYYCIDLGDRLTLSDPPF